MKALLTLSAAVLLFVSLSFAQGGKTYIGEIMDSACAVMGPHAAMTQKNPNMTAKDCTVACVGHGAKYVLYDAATKTVYQLSDQTKPAQFAGAKSP